MLKTFIILLLSASVSVSQSGCKSGKERNKVIPQKEFEGVITYHEITTDRNGEFDCDDTVHVFYSHGNYVGIHSGAYSPKFRLAKDYYLEKRPLRLLLFNNSDTLHQLNLTHAGEKLDDFKVIQTNDRILSRKCERIDIKTSYAENDTTYSNFSLVFSRGYLPVDKAHFRNWNTGFFNQFINETGSFYLKLKAVHFDSSHKKILSTKTYEVISVKEQPVDPEMFRIDSSRIKWSE